LHFTVDGTERIFPLEGEEIHIGRGTDNHIVLPDASVSRQHALLRRGASGWTLLDLGSTNGVRVNQAPVRSQLLLAGDRIQVGAFELTLEALPTPSGGDASSTATVRGKKRRGETPGGRQRDLTAGTTVVRPLAEFAASYGLGGGISGEIPVLNKRQVLEEAYSNRIFGYLTRLAGLLLTADTVDEVLSRVMGIAFEALPVERGFILLLDEEGNSVCELARLGDKVRRRPAGEVPVSRTMLAEVMRDRVALITLDAQSDQRLRQGESIRLHQIRAAMCVPLWSGDRIIGVMQVDTPYRTETFTEKDLDFLTALANYAAVAIERLRYAATVERERRFRERLERYHSPLVIDAVMRRDDVVGGMGSLRSTEATVLFADLVGFTAVAETLDPRAVANLLAGFFNTAVEAIFDLGGTLDKFIGDCVMAFFGAPVRQRDHALRAVKAAMEIQRGLAAWNTENQAAGEELPPLVARIGINTGPVVVGEVGSSRRVDYTVLGNTVNVAARLEAHVAGPGDVILGSETHRLVGGAVATEPLGDFQLRGLSQKVVAFRVRRQW